MDEDTELRQMQEKGQMRQVQEGRLPLQRAGQPEEVAPSYVFLASNDSSYMTGQVLHVNGGMIVNG